MGRAGAKKKRGAAGGEAAPAAPKLDPDDAEFLKRAHELKEEGNTNFQSKNYGAALVNYDHAIKLTPKGHSDLAILYSNRAACLLQIKPVQYDAVVAECSLALELQPKYAKALSRRARAYEAQGKLQLALTDTELLLQADPNNQEGLDLIKRIRASLETKVEVQQDSRRRTAVTTSASSTGSTSAARGPSLPAKPVGKKKTSKSLSDKDATVLDEGSDVPRGHAGSSAEQVAGAKDAPADGVPQKPRSLQGQEGSTGHGNEAKALKNVDSRPMRPLKLIYGHDIRLAEMPIDCGFGKLRDVVRQKFPSSKAVLVKYKDSEDDLITITSRAELRLAEAAVAGPDPQKPVSPTTPVEGNNYSPTKSQEVPQKPTIASPALLRLYVVDVNPEQEPPIPEDDALPEVVEEDVQVESMSTPVEEEGKPKTDLPKVEVKNGKIVKTEDGQVVGEEMEIDDWLFDFAQLFRNHVGIDPDGHVDFHELGMELCSEALESVVTSEEAQPLFEAAAAKFQEVAALAFFNWGNVFMCAARKRVPMDDSTDKPAQLKAAYEWAQSHYKLAGQKYEEALKIKGDFYEGVLALGQEKFESAKLQWASALASGIDIKTWDASETLALYHTAEDQMRTAAEMWELLEEQQRAANSDASKNKKETPKADAGKLDGPPEPEGGEPGQDAVDQGAAMRSQINLFWGNVLFEHSQVEYRLGLPSWQERLDAAVKKFKTAGASNDDISGALKNHPFSEAKKEAAAASSSASASNGAAVGASSSSNDPEAIATSSAIMVIPEPPPAPDLPQVQGSGPVLPDPVAAGHASADPVAEPSASYPESKVAESNGIAE